MAKYGYVFDLPVGLSADQNKKLIDLANSTARKASIKDTGKFRNGWSSGISSGKLKVQTNVAYASIIELGRGYHAKNKFKVRNALMAIGFEDMFAGVEGTILTPQLATEALVGTALAGTAVATAVGSPQGSPSSSNTAQDSEMVQSPSTTTLDSPTAPTELPTLPTLQDNSISLPTLPSRQSLLQSLPSRSNINNQTSLLALIAAAVVANEALSEDEEIN